MSQSPAILKRWITVALLCVFGAGPVVARETRAQATAGELASRVVIVANDADPDSLRIAHHYAEARGVPVGNIISLPLPMDETVTWTDFVARLWEPLLQRLVHDRWIDAIPMDLTDAVGRRKYVVQSHRIAALVLCRGVPLRIAHDPALYSEVLPFTARGEFRTNAASVDGELSLLSAPNHPINAYVPNPLFGKDKPTEIEQQQVVKVSRLDGPNADDALQLVDRALVAERDGLLGRAYIDFSDRDAEGNAWLESCESQVRRLGFDLAEDRAPAVMPATARADAPALYFGWYSGGVEGPFALPGFRFPPGAIALHIHSFSAGTLRAASVGWAGPFVAHGVTATFGNVYEPYLDWTHHPDVLLRALAGGANLVDAAYTALPALSWHEVVVGDPLYRPFSVTLDQQMRRLATLPAALAPYAVLRRAHVLEAAGRNVELLTLLEAEQAKHPSLPLGLELARRLEASGNKESAVAALSVDVDGAPVAAAEWGLVRDAAETLKRLGQPARAVALYRTLFSSPTLPREFRITLLPRAAEAAEGAQDLAQLAVWRRELGELNASGPGP